MHFLALNNTNSSVFIKPPGGQGQCYGLFPSSVSRGRDPLDGVY